MLIPGLVSATFKERPVEEVIELAASHGLQAIEWSENWHVQEGDVEEAIRIAALTKQAGLQIATFGSYYRLGKGMDIFTRIEVAKALGASVIRIWGGDRPSSELDENTFGLLVDEARKISLRCAQRGLTIALEWHKNTVTDTNESGTRFLNSVGNACCRTLWQPTMALTVSQRVAGLRAIGSRLVNLHVYHWDETGRRPLAEGADVWRGYFAAVDRSEDHYALLEFVKDDSVRQFADDAAILLQWLERENRIEKDI